MVKSVIGDENQLKLAEHRLTRSSIPSQIGLVIGKLNSKLDRGFVYDLVPTPPNDAGEQPCLVIDGAADFSKTKKKTSSKPKSQSDSSALFIDQDWVFEHARQVSRMLLGGMKVVGVYVWVSESLFKNSTITLCQTVIGVAQAASTMMDDLNERLLLHISYSPLRWTCRNCSLAANITSSSLWPCDFKTGKILGSLQTFRCMYNFDVRLPIPHGDGLDSKRFSDVIRNEIMVHAKELKGVKALIDGKLVVGDDLSVSDDFHEVEFLLPFMQDKYLEACSQKEVLGVLLLRGSVCSLAYLNSKEPVSQALVDIKEDIIRSLQSRLAIICDEAERDIESMTGGDQGTNSHISSEEPVTNFDLQAQRKQCNLSFPRRVLVPWLEGTYICDYIQSTETLEVLKEHCVELMSVEFPTDTSEILEPESEAPTVIASSTAKTFWSAATDHSSAAKPDSSVSKVRKTGKGRPATSADYVLMLTIFVLIIAIVVFYFMGV
ncbi:oxidoreductase [Perilla frutescens var. hirtella]|uniref:Oxidoreductase n=1 Tax=Perilla frutescens var. hirtella TaxID=608512 RepID=A0AAD4JRD2_PERFH|nr:oxidoreductase [Perilla frutescens var. hirtella]